jgi:hypothetical protein
MVFQARISKKHLFKAAAPYDRALDTLAVIQDVGAWLQGKLSDKKERARLAKEFDEDLGPLRAIGGWLGIPLPKGSRGRAILVVNSNRPNHFTAIRVQTFNAMATRLAPLFLWALAEAQQDWMPLSLAHTRIPNKTRLDRVLETIPDKGRAYLLRLFDFQEKVFSSLRLLLPNANRTLYAPRSVDVTKTINEVIDLLQDERRPIDVSADSPVARVTIEPELLEIALFNLLENAVRYSKPDTRVHIRISVEGDCMVLAVRNHVGGAIPLAQRKRINGLFERAAQEPAQDTGIGLALISRFCELTEMKCALADAGEATLVVCFTLEVPLDKSGQETPRPLASPSRPPPQLSPPTEPPSPGPVSGHTRSLHYVDNESSFVHVLDSKLSFTPDVVLHKYVCPDAVDRFMRTEEVDVADAWFLLDIMMPVPTLLSTAHNVWPAGHVGDRRICGIALCAWLVFHRGVDRSRIALLTSMGADRNIHHTTLDALHLASGEKGPAYIQKHILGEIERWLVRVVGQ